MVDQFIQQEAIPIRYILTNCPKNIIMKAGIFTFAISNGTCIGTRGIARGAKMLSIEGVLKATKCYVSC